VDISEAVFCVYCFAISDAQLSVLKHWRQNYLT